MASRWGGKLGRGVSGIIDKNFIYFDPNGVPQYKAALARSPRSGPDHDLWNILLKSQSLLIVPWLDPKSMTATDGLRCPACASADDIERTTAAPVNTNTKEDWKSLMALRICEL